LEGDNNARRKENQLCSSFKHNHFSLCEHWIISVGLTTNKKTSFIPKNKNILLKYFYIEKLWSLE
jgi:hypothetical protein